MKFDMIVSGVGGQGILSISFVVDNAALEENYHFKQSEVHGMAQRGGAVISHLRVSDEVIYSDLVPKGSADLLLSMEPLETLRYLDYRSPEGAVVTSISPFLNIPNYPDVKEVIGQLQEIENHTLVNAADLARAAGSHYAQNIVMLGAASHLMPMENKTMEKFIGVLFKSKGEKVVNTNIEAFRSGALAGGFYHDLLAAGMPLQYAATVATSLKPYAYSSQDVADWVGICERDGAESLIAWLDDTSGLVEVGRDVISTLKKTDFQDKQNDIFAELLG